MWEHYLEDDQSSEDQEFAHDFQTWLNQRIESDEGVSVSALLLVLFVLVVRLRVVFTDKDMKGLFRYLRMAATETMRRPDGFIDADTGESLTMLMAEETDQLGVQRGSMHTIQAPLEVPEEWFGDS